MSDNIAVKVINHLGDEVMKEWQYVLVGQKRHQRKGLSRSHLLPASVLSATRKDAISL